MVLATFTAWSRYLKLLRLRRGTARTLQITYALDLLKHCWAPFGGAGVFLGRLWWCRGVFLVSSGGHLGAL